MLPTTELGIKLATEAYSYFCNQRNASIKLIEKNQEEKNTNKFERLSKTQFDELFRTYRSQSWYRMTKDCLPTTIGDFFTPDSATDNLINAVNAINKLDSLNDDKKEIQIASTVKIYMSSKINLERCGFCIFLNLRPTTLSAYSNELELGKIAKPTISLHK